MLKAEVEYWLLVSKVLNEGQLKNTRNGETKSIFASSLEFDLSKGYFPILSGRKMHYKGVLGELEAFLNMPKNVEDFKKAGCNYWGLWADKDTGALNVDYGNAWLNWNNEGINQLRQVADTLKVDPYNRRLLVTGWNPSNLADLSLPCCHIMYQWGVREVNGVSHLDMLWIQRSADVMIGVPSDMILAAALNIALANEVGMVPGKVTMVFGDTHIYAEHIDDATVLAADVWLHRYSLPTYSFNMPTGTEVEKFSATALAIDGYDPGPAVQFKLKA